MAYLLQQLLTEAAARHPQRPAIAASDCLVSYSELDRLSNQVARSLLHLGVAPGDRVAVLAPKSAAAVAGLYGVLKAGACYVPLDPKAPAQRLSYVLHDCGATVIVTDEARMAQAAALAGSLPGPGGVVVASFTGSGTVPAADTVLADTVLAEAGCPGRHCPGRRHCGYSVVRCG